MGNVIYLKETVESINYMRTRYGHPLNFTYEEDTIYILNILEFNFNHGIYLRVNIVPSNHVQTPLSDLIEYNKGLDRGGIIDDILNDI
jgi:hypothetical protein